MRGRIRTVKPEAFLDEDLWDLEQESGLPIFRAFTGLWTQADREGRFEWRPRPLQAAILPYWSGDFSRVLDALATRGFVLRYEVGTRVYGLIPSFKRHQAINGKEPASEIPAPPENVTKLADLTREQRVHDASTTGDEHAPGLPAGTEGKGREGSGSDACETRDTPAPIFVPDLEPGEPGPQTPLPEVIRQGYRRRYHAALQNYPAEANGKAVAKLSDWCTENAKNHRTTAAALAERVLDGLFRSPRASEKRFPLAYAAHDPLEFLGAKARPVASPASDGLRAELAAIDKRLRECERDSWEHTDLGNKRAELLTRISRAEAAA